MFFVLVDGIFGAVKFYEVISVGRSLNDGGKHSIIRSFDFGPTTEWTARRVDKDASDVD